MSTPEIVGYGRESKGPYSQNVQLKFNLVTGENNPFGGMIPDCVRVMAFHRTDARSVSFYDLDEFKALVERLHEFVNSQEYVALQFKEAVKDG